MNKTELLALAETMRAAFCAMNLHEQDNPDTGLHIQYLNFGNGRLTSLGGYGCAHRAAKLILAEVYGGRDRAAQILENSLDCESIAEVVTSMYETDHELARMMEERCGEGCRSEFRGTGHDYCEG